MADQQPGPEIGPQCAGDNAFRVAMRLHKSRWRVKVRGVPCGTGPRRMSRTLYGNKLRGERGLNFLVDPDATLQRWPLGRICRALEPLLGGTPHEPWLEAFRRRYAVPG